MISKSVERELEIHELELHLLAIANLKDSLETQEKILGFLSEDHVKTVVLSGEAGVGKTWMAKKTSNSASHNGSCYGAIWVRGCNYEGKSLVENIAIQLSVVPSDDEWEEDDNTEMEQQEQEKALENLKWRIQEKLKLMKTAKLDQMKTSKPEEEKTAKVDQKDAPGDEKGPYILVVLDDFDNMPIGKVSQGRPGVIIMIAEAINRVKDSELDNAVEEMASIIKSADNAKLWQHVYQMLPSTLSKCCWHCRYLFVHHNKIHYNELTAHWLLEGYFGHHDHYETAYEEARHTLMEFKVRGFLKEKEDSYISMDSDALGVEDHRRDGLSGSAHVGVASVLGDHRWAGLGRVIQSDGMIKTSKKSDEMSTLFIDGARFRREVPETFLQHKNQLKVLVIINPMFEKVPSQLAELKELQVLVLRGCHILKSVDEIHKLINLLVLEISGARMVKQIRDDIFEHMKDLRSLNLSEVGIRWLPASLLNRSELRWLILRKCPNLNQLCDTSLLKKKEAASESVLLLAKLEVLDFSGSDSFWSDCPSLARLPTLKPLTKLKILDLSMTTCLKEVQDDPQETKTDFRVLNLTGSAVNKLPLNISSLSHLLLTFCKFLLKNCKFLTKLQNLPLLQKLEVLDLLGSSELVITSNDSFRGMSRLKTVNLSETKIESLPRDCFPVSLRHLIIRNCPHWNNLPSLEALKNREVINLCDDSSLRNLSELVKENLRSIKSCWLDRCKGISSIVDGEGDARASGKLYSLYLCNLSSLSCVCDDSVQSEVFGGLKHLYIDCCPMLISIFPFSKLPKKLETLQIKFCEKMERLVNPDMPVECNLQTLDLLELPKLKRIRVMMVSLRVLKVRQCPDLENLEEVLGGAENLEVLHIFHAAMLERIRSQTMKPGSFKNLKQLKIQSCPQLEQVSPSSELPPNLEILEIDSCNSLKTIFGGSFAGTSLKRLKLCNLPSLSSTVFIVPHQCHVVSNCQNLQIDRSS
ncbi:hypothetical protein EUGRSUZ_D00770 [Eucalyptus grandis]|uniref:Uncharacterized protein n=2 Tax=Eucalyptus grandis TaxID=71139 RepID=A0A059CDR6_EUCGR|nr:hypothetical protein EUGRSUZ_D00770 [Eucalyptus grandis]